MSTTPQDADEIKRRLTDLNEHQRVFLDDLRELRQHLSRLNATEPQSRDNLKETQERQRSYLGTPKETQKRQRSHLDTLPRNRSYKLDPSVVVLRQPENTQTPLSIPVSEEEPQRAELTRPPLDDLRHLLQNRFPVLYAKVLEPTLADLREEHSAALAEGRPLKARCALLRGCGALAAAAFCHLGFSLLGRITALWKARSPK